MKIRLNTQNLILILFLFSVVFVSCGGAGKKPHYQADISGIKIDPVSINRYEEMLFSLNPFALKEEIQPFIDQYAVFLGEKIETEEGQQQLFDYITDPQIRELYLDTEEVWPDVVTLEGELTEAFRYYRYHFPEQQIPSVFTYISGLDYQYPVKDFEGSLVIGLDMYLGKDYHLYPKVGVPSYQTFGMQPAFVAIDVMKLLGERRLGEMSALPERFLDFMVYEGKILYFLDCMLPQHHDTLKMTYTSEQLGWLQNNMGRAWSYFLENEMLYSSDRQIIIKFLGDAPFTAPFSRNAPPRTASYIGWQIVRKYMEKNPDKGLIDLFRENDAQKILNQSGFRP
ncbi:MAG: hypothetical protein V2I46_10710 [Bacteroides sp.]|jgi:hypothetical protein|nr:hypothetical protein [Bacteroides sp.]